MPVFRAAQGDEGVRWERQDRHTDVSYLTPSLLCCWLAAPICALDEFAEPLLRDRYCIRA